MRKPLSIVFFFLVVLGGGIALFTYAPKRSFDWSAVEYCSIYTSPKEVYLYCSGVSAVAGNSVKINLADDTVFVVVLDSLEPGTVVLGGGSFNSIFMLPGTTLIENTRVFVSSSEEKDVWDSRISKAREKYRELKANPNKPKKVSPPYVY